MLFTNVNRPQFRDADFRKKVSIFLIGIFGFFFTSSYLKADPGFDALSFKPANDQGYYLTVEQSQTLGQWGHAIGVTGDFSSTLVLKNASGIKVQDVIQKQLARPRSLSGTDELVECGSRCRRCSLPAFCDSGNACAG